MRPLVIIHRVVAALLTVALVLPAFGCGADNTQQTEYTVKKDGVEYGTQVVRRESGKGKVIYSCTERFPYLFQDTTFYRKLTFSGDLEDLLGYSSNRMVPGASFRSSLKIEGDNFSYLSDELQTFRYIPRIDAPGGCIPLEPDSVCLLQGITAKFLKSGVEEASALLFVPSEGLVVQQAILRRNGKREILISGELLGEVTIGVDENGTITSVKDSKNNVKIAREKAGKINSRPYEGDTKGIIIQSETIETSDDRELAGSLYLPRDKKPYPAVILVADFGPQDRTGNGVLSQIAVKLAGEGIAVLACDKRGVPSSNGDYATYTFDTAGKDLNDQIDYMVLRGDIDIDRIAVLGYGEGGAILAAVAPSNPYVSACVFMATPSIRLFPDLVFRQITADTDDSLYARAEKSYEALQIENLTRLVESTNDETVEIEGKKMFLGWMRSQDLRDPAGEFSAIKVPVLVLQGGKDTEVDAGQASEIERYLQKGGNPDVELALYEDLDHYFGPLVTKPPYREHPKLDERVPEKISTWFKSKLKVK